MPVTPTYPGVYIEELPSGVRTIVGVATSITAFIGRARKGPVNEPIRIQSFADFERTFGGLQLDSMLSYAVRHFFQSGGSDALIVRVVDDTGIKATVALTAGTETLTLEAVDAGASGNHLRATVDYSNVTGSNFNLTIRELDANDNEVNREDFSDIAPGNLGSTLEDGSALVRVQGDEPATRPNEVTDAPCTGGEDAAARATISVPANSDTETLTLEAANAGAWGNNLQVLIDDDTSNPSDTYLFNLTVQYVEGGEIQATETFRNVSVENSSSRFITDVLKNESNLVSIDANAPFPSTRPDENTDADGDGLVDPTPSNHDGRDGPIPSDAFYIGSELDKTGLYALEKADLFNLLCIPPATRQTHIADTTWSAALIYCKKRRAMLLIDPPLYASRWNDTAGAESGVDPLRSTLGADNATNAMLYFPGLKMADPLKENRTEEFVPCGAVAGIIARTDAQRGIWKAPAGLEATFSGVRELTYKLTDAENGRLNPLGVNCLRAFPVVGRVIWGARTLAGADRLASEWKYVPVRRLALYIEESLYRGTQWVVFEPNDEPLWAQIRLNLGAFMHNLFRQGAFQGKSPREAYFVKCDKETTTQNDINLGIVNIVVGFAPLKPAEFVILKIQQMAGQTEA